MCDTWPRYCALCERARACSYAPVAVVRNFLGGGHESHLFTYEIIVCIYADGSSLHGSRAACMYVCMYACMYIRTYVCVGGCGVCMYVRVYVSVGGCGCTSVLIHMYVCMYVFMYVYVHVHTYMWVGVGVHQC
jgi:hypothetical protein